MQAALVFTGLADELRAIVREELERAVSAPTAEGYLNLKRAAEFLDVTEDALRARVRRREIPIHRRDGRLYFSRAELGAYVRGEVA